MRTFILSILLICTYALSVFSNDIKPNGLSDKYASLAERYNSNSSFFREAYAQYPSIPGGILEAVSWSKTRMRHIPSSESQSCTGMPLSFTIMGLVQDGKNYFKNTLDITALKSGDEPDNILLSPQAAILAYAKAFSVLQSEMGITSSRIEDNITVLEALSELPDKTDGQRFALDCEVYQVLDFLNDEEFCKIIGIAKKKVNFIKVFGKNNYAVLSSGKVTLAPGKITGKNSIYTPKKKQKGNGRVKKFLSSDYPPALWNAAASCNYTVGRTQSISAVTIHTVQGSYAGCISWFQNCNASVSAHYVIRSSDGQVTQMVLESNKAWHVGSENPYTIGYEHEGYVSDPSWYTTAMYTSSANLTKDVCNSGYGINPHRTGFWPWLASNYYNQSGIPGSCTKIKGHQHFPNQTHNDPGNNWNWDYYFMLINDNPTITTYTASSGTFYDSGGGGGNYTDDERKVYVISPTGATSVTLTFTSFSLENTWDYLYIYDGNSVWASRIGYYTGTSSPGTVTSSGGSITVEFRSDCATTGTGWAANWTSNNNPVTPSNLTATSNGCNQIGVTLSWANSGSGWFVDVSTDSTFATFYNKDVSNLTSTVCPGSFCDYPGCTSYLDFYPNTTYYWRIFDGTTWTNGPSFTTPLCASTDPSCSGTFYDSGGQAGAYAGNEDYTFTIAPSLSTSVTMTFTAFDLENGYDYMYIYNGPDTLSQLIGSYTGTTSPGSVTATSGILTIRFKSDPFVNNSGWAATWSCVQNNTPPSTSVSVTGNWQTQDFNAGFTDTDNNGSGLDLLFYQPLEYNGTEWRANNGNGFFNDNFDLAIHPDWTTVTGTWAISSGYINQSDEANGNSNIYAPLTQTSTEIYLFHWGMNMGGTGTNRRAGLHFFCDNPTLTNRGNSYFVWFRADQDACQIYEVVNDVFAIQTDDTVAINPNTWYDCKVIFNPQSGEIKAYLNNALVSQWTDSSPFTSGNSISLRTGNTNVLYNDLKVYRARSGNNVTITVGSAATNDIRYQNPDPLTPSCRIKSIIKDSVELWSAPATQNVNIDWTPPSDPVVNDGLTWDKDTVFVNNELSANWTNSVDTNSDVVRYWYIIGSAPGDSDVVQWTDNGLNTSVTVTGLNLTYGAWYFYSVQSENGAGLFSNVISSDGVYIGLLPSAGFSPSSSVICAGETVSFTNYSMNADSFQWQFSSGNPSTDTTTNPVVQYNSAGVFSVTLIASNTNGSDTLVDYITVNDNPSVTLTKTDVICNGSADGTATASATGGSGSYSYLWNSGATTASVNMLPAGIYTVTITDSAGCSVTDSIFISEPLAFTVNLSKTDATCNGSPDGTATALPSGGTGTYSFQWSNGATSAVINGLTPGTYSVTVADGNGCTTFAQTSIGDHMVTALFSQDADTINLANDSSIAFSDQGAGATGWQWDFGNGTSSTQQNPVAWYDSTGTFQVMMIASDSSCSDTAFGQVVVVLITENSLRYSGCHIYIYPNPSGQMEMKLRIANCKLQIANFTIQNITGQTVFNSDFHNSESEIFLYNLSAGIYYYRITIDNAYIQTGKLLIE